LLFLGLEEVLETGPFGFLLLLLQLPPQRVRFLLQ
jgi:hypothetical protein